MEENSKQQPRSAEKTRSQDSLRTPRSGSTRQKKASKQGGMKMMFVKLKQKLNLTKKTDISKDLLEQFNRLKQYQQSLHEVAMRMRDVTQPNVEYTQGRRELVFEAPENLDEYEQIYSSLEKNRAKGKPLESYENIEYYSPCAYNMAQLHREYHRNAAEALKPVGAFLFQEYPNMEAQLGNITNLRDDKDVKEHDFQKTGTGGEAAQEAAKAFEKACDELVKTMSKALGAEDVLRHVAAMEIWQGLVRQFHEKMTEELEKVIKKCDEAARKQKQ